MSTVPPVESTDTLAALALAANEAAIKLRSAVDRLSDRIGAIGRGSESAVSAADLATIEHLASASAIATVVSGDLRNQLITLSVCVSLLHGDGPVNAAIAKGTTAAAQGCQCPKCKPRVGDKGNVPPTVAGAPS